MISVNHRIRGTTKKKNFNHKGAEGAQRKDKIEEIDPVRLGAPLWLNS
jgi:hypothetical protein